MSIKSKLLAIVSLMTLFLLFIGFTGMQATDQINSSLGTVYKDRVVPLRQLKLIADAYAVSVIDAVNKSNAGLMTAQELRNELAAASALIAKEWQAYSSTQLTPQEARLAEEAKVLFDVADEAMANLSKFAQGLSGDISGQLDGFDGELYEDIDPISNKIGELINLQLDVAHSEYEASQQVYSQVNRLSIGLMLAGVLLALAAVWVLFKFVIRPLQKALKIANAVAQGDLNNHIRRNGKDEAGRLLTALGQVQDAVVAIIDDQRNMAQAHREGRVSVKLEPSHFEGAYAEIASEVNCLVETHIDVENKLVAVSREYAKGNFSVDMDQLPGEQAAITEALAEVKTALLDISGSIKQMAAKGADGDFSCRVNANGYQHLFREIVADLNRLLGTCDKGFGDICRVTGALSDGDLSQTIDASYPGVFGMAAHSVNQTVSSLRQTLGDVEAMVASACDGNFGHRLHEAGQAGYRLRLAQQLNSLSAVTESGLKEINAVVSALSNGKLDRRMEGRYPGLFGQTQAGVNGTVDALSAFVTDIDTLVNAAARHGDFSGAISLEGRTGFLLELSTRLNELAQVTRDGLQEVKYIANAIAEGELNARVSGQYPGLFGETLGALDGTVARLRNMVGEIQDAASTLRVSAREIASGNMDLSNRTESQAHSVEETVANFRSLSDSIGANTDNAVRAASLASASAQQASLGAQIVADVENTMNNIGETSEQIANITGMIDSIAFQTNILALNAAVEAARAGDSGRGFGVVAAEVRSLASRSAEAAREIREVINAAASRISAGNEQASKAGKAMNEIDGSVQSVAKLLEQIANSSKSQGQGMVQVQGAIDQIDGVTQHNAALVEQASAAAASMQSQVERLANLMSVFKLGSGMKKAGATNIKSAPAPKLA